MSAATRLQAMDSLAAFLHERLVEDERREAAHSAVNRRARLAVWWQAVVDVAVTVGVHLGVCHIEDR